MGEGTFCRVSIDGIPRLVAIARDIARTLELTIGRRPPRLIRDFETPSSGDS